jgi:hypothetical protein
VSRAAGGQTACCKTSHFAIYLFLANTAARIAKRQSPELRKMRRPRASRPALILSLALVSSSESSAYAPIGTDGISRTCSGSGRFFATFVAHASSSNNESTAWSDEAGSPDASSDDERAVRAQLGYLPSNYVRVTSYTLRGKQPVAIQTYPLNGGAVRRKTKAKGDLTPFPTLYWLANAEISRAVANLERRGFVGVLEERLRSDDSYVADYKAAHMSYAEERWQSLTGPDRAMLESGRGNAGSGGGEKPVEDSDNDSDKVTPGMVRMIQSSGIAGRIPPFEPCIKCLHSHYAHYRSGGDINIVGKWVGDLLLEEFPELDL